ncbi:hypothetical protein LEP3755_04080 [Leptolyngbya sp. NIES-3755]|nr:hypothetical protein LEP3755_04080 [Leptolyngbya sp. NIES-3755]
MMSNQAVVAIGDSVSQFKALLCDLDCSLVTQVIYQLNPEGGFATHVYKFNAC